MTYEVVVAFDDDTADAVTLDNYFRALRKYNARGIGNVKNQTSSMFMSSEEPLNLEELTKDLSCIKILSVRKN
jgi:hypothetical protein